MTEEEILSEITKASEKIIKDINDPDTVNTLSDYKIREEAIRIAQKITQDNGLNVGDSVVHPDDIHVYKLQSIFDDGTAIAWRFAGMGPNREEFRKQFLLKEILDYDVGKEIFMLIEMTIAELQEQD